MEIEYILLAILVIAGIAVLIVGTIASRNLSKNLGFDKPRQKPQRPPQKPQPRQPITPPQQQIQSARDLYDFYRMDYENFAVGVFDCLTAIAKRYNLLQVSNPRAVHSARVLDRVRTLENGKIIFIFEIRREPDYAGFREPQKKYEAGFIANVFETDLPSYLTGGYSFDGHVVGFDVDDKTVRLEIHEVYRQIIDNGGYLVT